ncbi:hypothetical protein J7J90_00835 [Candidatus Micrarchaeota archaeon]|nr:hypothetical protein [Candidatus Micrarchaeota archaeon]
MPKSAVIDSSYVYNDEKRRKYLKEHNYHLSFDMIDNIQKKIEDGVQLNKYDYGAIIQVLYGSYDPFTDLPYTMERDSLLGELYAVNDQLKKFKGGKNIHKCIDSLILEIELMKVKGILEKMTEKFEQQGDVELAQYCAEELKKISDEFPSKSFPVPQDKSIVVPSTVKQALNKTVFNPKGCKELYTLLGRATAPERIEAIGKGNKEAYVLLSMKDIGGPLLHMVFSDGKDVKIIDDKNGHPRMQVYNPETKILQLYKWYNGKIYNAAIEFRGDGSARVISGGYFTIISSDDVEKFIEGNNGDFNSAIFNVDLRDPKKAVDTLSISIKNGVRPAGVDWVFNKEWSNEMISDIIEISERDNLPPEFLFSVLMQEGYPIFVNDEGHIRITKYNYNTISIDTYQNIGLDAFYDTIPELKKRGYLSKDWYKIPPEKEKEYNAKYIPGVNASVAAEKRENIVTPVDTIKYSTSRIPNDFIQYNEAGDRWHKIYIKGLPNTIEALGAMLAYNRDKFLEYINDRGFDVSQLTQEQINAGTYLFYNRGISLAKSDLDKLKFDQIKEHLNKPYLTQTKYALSHGKPAQKPVFNPKKWTAHWNTSRVLAMSEMFKDYFEQKPSYVFK